MILRLASLQLYPLSGQHELCPLGLFRRRNTLNKKGRSNPGEKATLPLWETCHLCFRDNGEESNENKRVALCCTSPCLKGIWLANDINTSIEMR